MDAVLDWIKRLLYFSVFLTVFMQLLPGEAYKKYVRFFAGILLIILAVNPVLTFLSKENFADGILDSIAKTEETVDMELDVDALEQAQQDYYRRQAELSVEDVVIEQAQQMDLTVSGCDVVWSADGEQIDSITVKVAGTAAGEEKKDDSQTAMDDTVIERIRIHVGETTKESVDESDPVDADMETGLKKKLMQTFELEESQVQILYG